MSFGFFVSSLFLLSFSSSLDKIHQANGCCFFSLMCVCFFLVTISRVFYFIFFLFFVSFLHSALLFRRLSAQDATRRGRRRRENSLQNSWDCWLSCSGSLSLFPSTSQNTTRSEPTRDKHIIPRDVAVKSWLEMKKKKINSIKECN